MLTISIRPKSVIVIVLWKHGGKDKVVSIKMATDKLLKSLIQYGVKTCEEKHLK